MLTVELGLRLRSSYAQNNQDILYEQVKEARDGIVFLLSLLLGFTLAMALTHYDQRKQLVVEEANAIGTTARRARLLPEPYSTQMTRMLADYADTRLAYFKAGNDVKSIETSMGQTNQLLSQNWLVAAKMVSAAPTPNTSIFIQSLNETFDISEKQIATLENRIPQSVWVMILIIAILASLASGMAVRRRMLFSTLIVPLMAAVVISLTADLDSPRSGVIRVGVGSMERVQANLHSPPPAARDR
jgi:hypothetical protein